MYQAVTLSVTPLVVDVVMLARQSAHFSSRTERIYCPHVMSECLLFNERNVHLDSFLSYTSLSTHGGVVFLMYWSKILLRLPARKNIVVSCHS
jgi:hypothetical protein